MNNHKKSIYTIVICSLLSMGLHLYLSTRSYSLASDKAEKTAICHISSTINCDQALSSKYSEFAHIPLSDWGFALNLIILGLALLILMAWTETPFLTWLIMSVFSALSFSGSLVMLVISLWLLKGFCPFCIVLYILSFTTLLASSFFGYNPFRLKNLAKCFNGDKKSALSKPFSYQGLKRFLQKKVWSALKKPSVWFFSASVSWVLVTLLTHINFINIYGIKSAKKTVEWNVKDWLASPQKIKGFEEHSALLKWPKQAPAKNQVLMTIKEFADFLCSYCKNSYYILKLFKTSHPNVQVEYFSFPLDQCKGQRVSCILTRAVYCAEKQNQGWHLHEAIFENQKKFIPLKDEQKGLKVLSTLVQNTKWGQALDSDKWLKCINTPSAMDAGEAGLKAGKSIGIEGTPAIFVNGKPVPNKYLAKTLKAIHHHLSHPPK